MSELGGADVTLRFFGDDLVPDEVTRLLGAVPTRSEKKGDVIIGKVSGQRRIAHTGGWRLRAEHRRPGDLDVQISEILDQLTDAIDVWTDITARFRADIFVGMFMTEGNEGISLSPLTLAALARRGLMIDFDIYAPDYP